MKTPISIAALTIASCGLLMGETVTTNPVGYMTITVPAQSDKKISVPLQTATTWSGASVSVATNTITFANSSFTAGQFGNGTHMIQVSSGTLTGRIFKILSNDTNSITVDPVGSNNIVDQGFAATNTVNVRPYWTLDTLFENGGGVGQNSDPFSPVTMIQFFSNSTTSINKSSSETYFYYDGSQGGDAGWYNNDALGDGPQGGKILDPANPIAIRNLTNDVLSIVMPGSVPMISQTALVMADTQDNDTILQQPFPTDISLIESNLRESGAVAASSDPFSPTDIVFTYDPAGTGLNPSSSGAYFYYDGSQGGDAGWYDMDALENGTIPTTTKTLKAGSQIVIRKSAGGALTATPWTAPVPYTP